MKTKNYKRMLASGLNTFSIGDNVTLETKDDRALCHDETDTSMISYVLEAASRHRCDNAGGVDIQQSPIPTFHLHFARQL